MWSKHAHAHSQFCEFETKCRYETLILPSSGRSKPTGDTHARVVLAWMKKKPKKTTKFTSNEKLKANRASETEEQMKEG